MPTTFVMVPVPEELADEVQLLLFRRPFTRAVAAWATDEVVDHVVGLRDRARSVVVEVAERTVRSRSVELAVVADALGISDPEIRGLTQELNETPPERLRWPLIDIKSEPTTQPDESRSKVTVLRMDHQLAQTIYDTPELAGTAS